MNYVSICTTRLCGTWLGFRSTIAVLFQTQLTLLRYLYAEAGLTHMYSCPELRFYSFWFKIQKYYFVSLLYSVCVVLLYTRWPQWQSNVAPQADWYKMNVKVSNLAASRITHYKSQHLFSPSLHRKASYSNMLCHRVCSSLAKKSFWKIGVKFIVSFLTSYWLDCFS